MGVKDDERRELKAKLQEEITELKGRMPTLTEAAKPVPPDRAVGRLSRMDAIGEQGVRAAALRDAKDRLQKLEARLEQSGNPDFGLCVACKKPIVIARLLFLPETNLCVDCAS